MLIEDSIQNFPKQFAFEPDIVGDWDAARTSQYIISGMGGSHLAGDIVKTTHPHLSVCIWNDYGLPFIHPLLKKETGCIVISYSGNTEEALDSLETALKYNIRVSAITSGGKLLKHAQTQNIPHIVIPDGLPPRAALGFIYRAILKIIGDEKTLTNTKELADILSVTRAQKEGEAIGKSLENFIPLLYASRNNASLALIWKIKCNETAKIPAFFNIFPELNHNEMAGFELTEGSHPKFHFVFMRDTEDDPRISKRMDILKNILSQKNLPVTEVALSGKSIYERVFQNLLVGDFAALALARFYKQDPTSVPIIETFKNDVEKSRLT